MKIDIQVNLSPTDVELINKNGFSLSTNNEHKYVFSQIELKQIIDSLNPHTGNTNSLIRKLEKEYKLKTTQIKIVVEEISNPVQPKSTK